MSLFKLPDLGEGLLEAEIIAWHCKPGDILAIDEAMVSLETAKAIVEIPSPEAGVVIQRYGDVGDIIHTGDPLLDIQYKTSAKDSIKPETAASHFQSHTEP